MSRNNTAELILGANNQRLKQGLAASSRDVQNFSTRTKTMLAGLGASLKRNLLSIPGQLGFIGGTAGLFMLGRNVVKFDEQLNRLEIQGNMTKKALLGLREETFRVALQTGKSRTDIVSGMDQIIERTGNVKFAVDTFKDLTIAARATGAEMADLGGLASQLDEKLGIKPEGLMSALDILTGQGKAGAFTLQNLAGLGARLFSSAARLNMAGEAGVARIGALSQIAMVGTGTPELATTAVERTLSNLISNEAKVKALGVKTRDALGKWLPIDQVLKDVVIKTKGDEAKLEKLFGDMGIRLMSQMAASFRTTGKFGRLDEFLFGDFKGTVAADFERGMQSISAQLGRTLALAEKIGESSLLPSLEKVNRYLQGVVDDPEKLVALDNKFKMLGKTIGFLSSGILLLFKNWKLLAGAFASYKLAKFIVGARGGRAASALGGALGGGGPAIPVYVVNMGAGLDGISGAIPPGGLAAPTAALAMGVGTLALQIGLVGAAAYAIADAIYKQYELEKRLQEDVDIYKKTGVKRVLTTAGSEQSSAPAVSLRNEIRLDVRVDSQGKLIGAAVLDSPAPGVSTQTFLESVFTGGDR